MSISSPQQKAQVCGPYPANLQPMCKSFRLHSSMLFLVSSFWVWHTVLIDRGQVRCYSQCFNLT